MGGRAAGEEQPAEYRKAAVGHEGGKAEMAALKEIKGRPEDIGNDAAPEAPQPKPGKSGLPLAETQSQAGEQEEQQNLRKTYVEAMRASLRGQLDHTTIVYPDGSKKKLSDIKKD